MGVYCGILDHVIQDRGVRERNRQNYEAFVLSNWVNGVEPFTEVGESKGDWFIGLEIKRLTLKYIMFDIINRCSSGDSEEEAVYMQVQFRDRARE